MVNLSWFVHAVTLSVVISMPKLLKQSCFILFLIVMIILLQGHSDST